jgi:hypothetical protein
MAKLWTVARSKKGFQAPLKNHVSSILADIQKASGRKRDLALAQWAELKRFLAESDQIRDGMAELPNCLRPVSNMAGRSIPDHYVLEVGALRGYYQVEEISRSCFAKLFRANADKIFEDIAILMLAPED